MTCPVKGDHVVVEFPSNCLGLGGDLEESDSGEGPEEEAYLRPCQRPWNGARVEEKDSAF